MVEMEVKNPSELNFSSYSATLEEDLLMEEILIWFVNLIIFDSIYLGESVAHATSSNGC